MPVFLRLIHRFNRLLLSLNWIALTLLVGLHFATSWALVWLADEHDISAIDVFWYFYMVTSTTVGYGDYSPATPLGRIIVSFWIMPGGISLFAAAIGKITQFLISLWRKRMQGHGDYSELTEHVVIMGWHDDRTRTIVEQILGDKRDQRAIILCSARDMENPLPENVHFVRGETLTSSELLSRAGVKSASRIIIYGETDEQTLATGLAVSATKTSAHIVAHFKSAEVANLFKAHCPNAECTSSISLELIVRSAQDPGSSRIQSQLLSTLTGPTQFCIQVPSEFGGCTYGILFYAMKEKHNATTFGIACSQIGNDLELNPENNSQVQSGNFIYFMAPERIRANEIDWDSLTTNT